MEILSYRMVQVLQYPSWKKYHGQTTEDISIILLQQCDKIIKKK